MPTIFLKPKKDAAVRRYHPWIFSGAIARTEDAPTAGDVVEVRSHDGAYLATGHWEPGSISVRILSYEPTDAGPAFWQHRLEQAYALRRELALAGARDTNGYRLVHAEGDGLPGLIIDYYDGTAVIQCHSTGMHRSVDHITQALRMLYGNDLQAVYEKSRATLPGGIAATDGYRYGAAAAQVIREHGHAFLVDWEGGQKTGFFLDQRDNRRLLAGYARDKTILNAFCYSGGFSVYALAAGARHVDSVDSSARAIELTNRNVELNQLNSERHRAHQEDVLRFLQQAERQYDLMVVDPPAYAKNLRKRHNAVQGYKRLNAAALQRLRPGGLLFTFSCSQVIDKPLFDNTIVAAALEAGRRARILHHLSQPPDHPVSLFHPEGGYLKGLVLKVE